MRGLDSKGSPGRNSELRLKIIEEKPELELGFLKKWWISNATIGFKRKSWSELRTSTENNRGKTRAGTRISKEMMDFQCEDWIQKEVLVGTQNFNWK